jgi:hypothetical protein
VYATLVQLCTAAGGPVAPAEWRRASTEAGVALRTYADSAQRLRGRDRLVAAVAGGRVWPVTLSVQAADVPDGGSPGILEDTAAAAAADEGDPGGGGGEEVRA